MSYISKTIKSKLTILNLRLVVYCFNLGLKNAARSGKPQVKVETAYLLQNTNLRGVKEIYAFGIT
jgi:hypothetical protein